MAPFKFPPPPPPPPKATANESQPSYASQRGGAGRGRGGNRGRGGDRDSGRGGFGPGGISSGQGRGNAHGVRGGSRGGYGNQHGGGNQQQYQPPQFAPATAPQPHMNPQVLAQAMSFASMPAGRQSVAAFSQQIYQATDSAPQHRQYPLSTQVNAPRYATGQQAGQKRKHPEHNPNAPPLPPKKPLSGPKPPRAKAAAPPPVPSFGFSLPTPAASTSNPKNKSYQKKRVNLGLSEQNAVDDNSSEGEDFDEEAAFADKIKVEGVAFEHNGEMISLQTAADVQAYIKDRRRNYPTQQRIVEKMQEATAKREHELEFLHRVKGKLRKAAPETRSAKPPKPERKPEREAKEVDTKKQEELAALRKKLHESMINKHQKPTNLLGAGYDSDSEAESSILSDSSVLSPSSDESSDDKSDEEDERSDSDAAPETIPSKAAPLPVALPPPSAPGSLPTTSQVCKNWSKTGVCKFGKGCRWAHPVSEKGSAQEQKKMRLFEKMVEQELEKRDRLALECIKYLGSNGFLG